jgi:hypothetical protein
MRHRRALQTSDIAAPGSSCSRGASACLRLSSNRSPQAPRGSNSARNKGFGEIPDLAATPTLREAWVPACAIGGSIPGCGGNPLGGAARKLPPSSNLDCQKAISFERVAQRVEKQMQRSASNSRHRPHSADILKAYPEAARVLQAVV